VFCPKCKSEYRPGFLRCSDCHIDLVDHLPIEKPAPEPEPGTTFDARRFGPDPELVVIRTFQSGFDANLAKSVLDAAVIDCVIRKNEPLTCFEK